MRDAGFTARFGATLAECKGPKATADCAEASAQCSMYNAAKAATCASKLSALSCTVILDANVTGPPECYEICSGSTSGGGGNGGSGGSGGSGGASLLTAADFCAAIESVTCDQRFACVPAAMRDAIFVSAFGNTATECKAMTPTVCSTAAADCQTYSSATAAICVSALKGATCSQFGDLTTTSPPAACSEACPGQFAP
jgi:hypothetical protein